MRVLTKHPLPIRITHWINVAAMAVMIWSGLLIFWAQSPYEVRVGDVVLVRFFPDWFFKALDLEYGLGEGMAYHFAFAWLFAVNGLIYVGYLIWSGEWRALVPHRRSFREAWHVALHDLRLRKQPLPPAKFNAAQRFAYTSVILMGAGSVLTGLAILKPTQLWWLCAAFGGYQVARFLHFALTIGFMLFVVVHLLQVAKAGWNNFRAMVAGFEVIKPAVEKRDVEATVAVGR
jgi:thiosulfate reductase cytochrome b subunit